MKESGVREEPKRVGSVVEFPGALDVPNRARGGRGRRVLRTAGLYGIGTLATVAALAFGVSTVQFYLHHVETDDAQIEGHVDRVLPKISGYVTTVLVRDNQRVGAGEVLARIDARDFEARVNMAEAALDNMRAAVGVARAQVEAAHSRQVKASADLTRYAELRRSGVVSPQEYDAARAAADSAAAEYDAAVRQVTAAEAQVAQKQADLDYARLQLSYTTITAPLAGTVSKKSVEIGQYVEAGQPLMAIIQDAEVWVVANFKETQLRNMSVGQAVAVEIDAYPQRAFRARIDSIASATGATFALLPPDNATGNFVKVVQRVPVKIVFTEPPDPEHPLRVGMNVNAVVDLRSPADRATRSDD